MWQAVLHSTASSSRSAFESACARFRFAWLHRSTALMKYSPIGGTRRACLVPNASQIAVGALSSGWRLVNWRYFMETSAKPEGSLADGFAMLAATVAPAAMPTNLNLKEIQMSDLERFIAASDARLEKKLALEIAQDRTETEKNEFDKKSAEASMARSFAAS